MKVEQKIVMVYTILGILSGFLTNYLFSEFGLIVAISTSFAIYFLSFLLLVIFVKKKKIMLFYNSFMTFLLVWLTIWILLYNLSG
jgi:O-antigen/teichoic acid export membrane protein